MSSRKNTIKQKNFLGNLIAPFLFLILSSLNALSCSNLKDFKLDHLSYEMVNYNSVLGNSEYKPNILNIKKTEDKIAQDKTPYFNDLFSNFHYNLLTCGSRTIVDSRVTLKINNNDNGCFDLKLITQPTLSVDSKNIGTEANPIYHSDYGQHYLYFSEIVQRHRGDPSTSFMFISDVLADKLIDSLNVPGKDRIEKYKNLIVDENFCFQTISIDDTYSAKVVINNIINTNYSEGQSKRIQEVYGDFSLAWTDRIKDKLKYSYEIDFKTNPYGNKKIIKDVESIGYKASNSIFSIKIYNGNEYSIDRNLSNKITDALQTTNDLLFICLITLIQIVTVGVCVLLNKRLSAKIDAKLSLRLSVALFFIYGIIVTFTYNYPFFSLTPIIFIVSFFFFYYMFNKNKVQLLSSRPVTHYEIEI